MKVEVNDFSFKLPKAIILCSFSKGDLMALCFELLKLALLSEQQLNLTSFRVAFISKLLYVIR